MRKRKCFFQMAIILVVICLNISALWADDNRKLNINTASAEELVQLQGIGPQKAAKIVEFRETNGPFQIPEDLIKVPGIGPKTFEANEARIVVKPD